MDKTAKTLALEKRSVLREPLELAKELRRLSAVNRVNPLQHALRIESLRSKLQQFKKAPEMYRTMQMFEPLAAALSAPFRRTF